ncbi:unnamed protein product [Lymnaea stagnalis]|uniref:Uncharacterized protein n=1 Tax=Lymnaea stagnalis TaxID=6523 RepID=A0AAV2IFA7_LYMST
MHKQNTLWRWLQNICLKPRQLTASAVLSTSENAARVNEKDLPLGTSNKTLPMSQMPGPKGLRKLPYLGTVLMFKPFSEYSPETFGKLVSSMHDKYGHIFKSRLGKDYSVHTDSVRDVETIFRTEGAYPQRRLMLLSKIYRERNGLPPALGTVSGPAWQELRSALNPLLNKPQVCLHYLPAQNMVADDFVSRLDSSALTPEGQSDMFFKFAAESIGVVCFNQRLGLLDPDADNAQEMIELLEAFKTTLHCTFVAMIGLERRYLRTDNDPFYRKYESAMKLIRKRSMHYVEKVMVELQRQSHQGEESSGSSTHRLSPDRESNLLASMITKSNLEIEKILAIIDSMLIAGTDSTARNLAILFYNLAINPEHQQRAADEVLDLLGPDKPVTPEALAKMNFLKSCVKESMRLNFPLSNGTERILNKDTILSGYLVPKGNSVIMSSSRSSLDSSNYDNPCQFQPDRWLRESSDEVSTKRLDRFATLPFGHGARGCIGRRFAEMEIYVGTAKILQKLHISVDPSYPGLDPIYTPFITPRLMIHFIFTKRHPPVGVSMSRGTNT